MLVLGGRLAASSFPALVINIMPCFSSQRSAEVFFLSVQPRWFCQFSTTGRWACPVQGTAGGWAEQSAAVAVIIYGAGNSLLTLCCSCCTSLRAGFYLVTYLNRGF